MPKFSVIIPIYNSEQYLKRCLDSVIVQSYSDFEIICVDDGSTDKSSDILVRYKLKEPRLKVITQSNSGQGSARNKALDVAQGEYIYFLDSDDYIDSTLLEEMLKVFKEIDTDLVCFNTEVCGDSEDRLFKRAKRYAQLTLAGLLEFTPQIKDTTNVYLWNKVFKSDLIRKYDIKFPSKLCYEDIAFSKMYFLVSEKIYFDMRRFHHYTVREDSLMGQNFKSEKVALDHFKNWYVVFKMVVKNEDLFAETKYILEKWFWDYYFMSKGLLKTPVCEELENLKEMYFKEFDDAVQKIHL